MAYHPNGWQSTICRGRPIGGAAPAYSVTGGWYSERFNRYVGEQWSRLFGGFPTSTYFPACAIPPRTPGGMASQSSARATLTTSLSMVSGRNMNGTVSCTLTVPSANLSLIANLQGSATLTLTVTNATLAAGIFGSGSTSASATVGPSTLGALAGIFSNVTCTLDVSTSTITAVGHLSGDILPYTELSPENLAAAVWNALASDYNAAGTMGEKLNDAGSAGNPWATEILPGYTAERMVNIIAAAVAGKTSGQPGSPVFRNLTDTGNQITATVDSSGNRTTVTHGA